MYYSCKGQFQAPRQHKNRGYIKTQEQYKKYNTKKQTTKTNQQWLQKLLCATREVRQSRWQNAWRPQIVQKSLSHVCPVFEKTTPPPKIGNSLNSTPQPSFIHVDNPLANGWCGMKTVLYSWLCLPPDTVTKGLQTIAVIRKISVQTYKKELSELVEDWRRSQSLHIYHVWRLSNLLRQLSPFCGPCW